MNIEFAITLQYVCTRTCTVSLIIVYCLFNVLESHSMHRIGEQSSLKQREYTIKYTVPPGP